MSTRWYPIYRKGNPQLRIFLPNFWMKIVPPQYKLPENIVEFHVSLEMTKYDVRNYLEKIYKINVKDVRTRIALGKFKRAQNGGYIIKEDDYKVAYVVLDKNEKFVFPELFKTDEIDKQERDEKRSIDEMKENYKKYLNKNNKPGIPGWFGI
ncbi:39S ribosomal protein L23, mitochondrial [Chelonus insularis]|uniref:39S ribosomal protein L23, mitochondrial n=1 Tax=Chelonus insularis TaxID=460826 RepID=UPI00158A85C5|nr:39S ribosomal protein L23, mitochondrial [Chelonus insularis]